MDPGVPLKRTLTGPEKSGSGTGFKLGNPFSGFGKKGDSSSSGLSSISEPFLAKKSSSGPFGHIRRASMNNLSFGNSGGAPIGASKLVQKSRPESPSPVLSATLKTTELGSIPLPPPAQGMTFTMEDYDIGSCIGHGSSALVYVGTHKSSGSAVSLKVIDLDMFERNQIDELRREIQIMNLSRHVNLLPVYGSFVSGSKLYIVTPLLGAGSCLDIMRTNFKEGLEESVIATILKQALQGLDYLHKNGLIHRDVKAGNLLVDSDGLVQLADFGVSSSLMETGERKGMRKTFVGTPSWMSPEVMEQCGYDYKADIWSFGITAIELATGHAPYSKFPPIKVLMLTLQNDPPTLDRSKTKHKYSKAFKDMIDSCLQKDPTKRPTAEKLLQHPFFKAAKKPAYLVPAIIEGLPPLTERSRRTKQKSETKEEERGVSWDFTDTERSLQAMLQQSGSSLKTSETIHEEGSEPLPPFKLESKKAIRFAPLDEQIGEMSISSTSQSAQLGQIGDSAEVDSPISNMTQSSNQSSGASTSVHAPQQSGKTVPLQVKKGRFSVVESSSASGEPPRVGSPRLPDSASSVSSGVYQQPTIQGSPQSAVAGATPGGTGPTQAVKDEPVSLPISTLERKMGRFAIQSTSPRLSDPPSKFTQEPSMLSSNRSSVVTSGAGTELPVPQQQSLQQQGQQGQGQAVQGSVLTSLPGPPQRSGSGTLVSETGGKSSRFTVSTEGSRSVSATASDGGVIPSQYTELHIGDLTVSQKPRRFVATSDSPNTGSCLTLQQQQELLDTSGLDMENISRILRGPDFSKASTMEDRISMLERHNSEQQQVIERLVRICLPVGSSRNGLRDGGQPVVGLGFMSQSQNASQPKGQDDRPI